jgi:hypothetical protein
MVAGLLIFIFDVRVERGHLRAGAPHLFQRFSALFGRGHIPLIEAARRACEETNDCDISVLARGLTNGPDDVLTWYCEFMTRTRPLLTLYGSEPPSRKIEEIYLAPLNRYGFVVEDGNIILKAHTGNDRYENLSVRKSQLKSAIRELRSVKV